MARLHIVNSLIRMLVHTARKVDHIGDIPPAPQPLLGRVGLGILALRSGQSALDCRAFLIWRPPFSEKAFYTASIDCSNAGIELRPIDACPAPGARTGGRFWIVQNAS